MISSVFRKIFGTKNDREVKKYIKRVAQINALEPTYEKMSDDELKIKFNELKSQVVEEKVTLDEILNDVLDKIKVSYNKSLNILAKEDKLIEKIFSDMLKDMPEEKRIELVKDMDLKVAGFGNQAIMAAIQAGLRAGGFLSYQITVIVANYVARLVLGRGLTLATNAALTKGLSFLIGPIGWAVTGIWTAFDIAGPAMRVTLPASVIVACLRKTLIYQSQK